MGIRARGRCLTARTCTHRTAQLMRISGPLLHDDRRKLAVHDATTADCGLAFRAERNSVPFTNRARTSSPRRHVLAQTRRTEPQDVNATAKISGTTIAPTSRQRPLADTVRIKHSIQGASGSTMINPDQFSSISSAALRLDKSIRHRRAVGLTIS
jgi:hypothetical protein